MSDHYESKEPPQISMKEALSLDPLLEARSSSAAEAKPRLSPGRVPNILSRASQYIKPRARRVTTGLLSRNRVQPSAPPVPPRPPRPPAELCPREQSIFEVVRAQVFPDAPPLSPRLFANAHNQNVPQITIHDPSLQAAPFGFQQHHTVSEVQQSSDHYNLASRKLEGYQQDIQEETSQTVDVENLRPLEDRLNVRGMRHYTGLDSAMQDDSPNASLSSLPSTTSNLALRPSPLRLTRHEHQSLPPPIPPRAPQRNANIVVSSESFDTAAGTITSLPRPILPHQRSHFAESIYSTDSNGIPARVPQIHLALPSQTSSDPGDHASMAVIDPNACADNLRDELGIIDGAYEMYANADRHAKHEAVE